MHDLLNTSASILRRTKRHSLGYDEQVCLSSTIFPPLSWCISILRIAGQVESAGLTMGIEENWFIELLACRATFMSNTLAEVVSKNTSRMDFPYIKISLTVSKHL